EHFPYQVPDSPSPTAFTDNTYEELGWTDVAVGQDEVISEWSITYDWYTMYPGLINGASFWVESPAGTIFQISGNIAPGTYTVNSDAFNGETMMGIWKIWIEDSFSQGGHQATGITMTFRKTIDPGPWLSPVPTSGFVVPGGMTQIEVGFDATTLDPGEYNGQLMISSNDPDEPQIELPVLFTVQGLPYLTLSEDSLIFLNYEQMWQGQEFTLKNPTPYNVQINEIEKESWGMFSWYIEPWDITLPYVLGGGDSLTLNVKLPIPVLSPLVWMVYDTLDIVSQYDLHQVIVGVDYNLISGTDKDVLNDLSVKISPNPFYSQVRIDLGLNEEKPVRACILDLTGKRVKSFREFQARKGLYTWYWDGTNDAGIPLSEGVYFLRIISERQLTTAKLILTR
ncbi:MAG TPA: T9SS type A sorting domain-containing protein, partial [Bacteroidales bacterium]|nr:T9SS type A sorting domain-containing protein [Bacteroidales bacterium]